MHQGSIAERDTPKISRYLRANANSIQREDHSYLDRIRDIQRVLKRGEKVLAVALQPRMLPGGSYLIPNIIYATNERIIVFQQHSSDLGGGKVSIPYDMMASIKLEEGPYFTLAVKFELSALSNVAGLGMIPRAKAEELIEAILFAIRRNSVRIRPPHLSDIKVGGVK